MLDWSYYYFREALFNRINSHYLLPQNIAATLTLSHIVTIPNVDALPLCLHVAKPTFSILYSPPRPSVPLHNHAPLFDCSHVGCLLLYLLPSVSPSHPWTHIVVQTNQNHAFHIHILLLSQPRRCLWHLHLAVQANLEPCFFA